MFVGWDYFFQDLHPSTEQLLLWLFLPTVTLHPGGCQVLPNCKAQDKHFPPTFGFNVKILKHLFNTCK